MKPRRASGWLARDGEIRYIDDGLLEAIDIEHPELEIFDQDNETRARIVFNLLSRGWTDDNWNNLKDLAEEFREDLT